MTKAAPVTFDAKPVRFALAGSKSSCFGRMSTSPVSVNLAFGGRLLRRLLLGLLVVRHTFNAGCHIDVTLPLLEDVQLLRFCRWLCHITYPQESTAGSK